LSSSRRCSEKPLPNAQLWLQDRRKNEREPVGSPARKAAMRMGVTECIDGRFARVCSPSRDGIYYEPVSQRYD
jgi:hypothetical protein